MLTEANHEPHAARTLSNLALRFQAKRKLTETLCATLTEADCMLSATEDTSPPKWHLAHTTWFFEHFVLREYESTFEPFSDSFDYLFNSYYRTIGEFLPKEKRRLLSRPSLSEIYQYRHATERRILMLLNDDEHTHYAKIVELVELGIQHEQQHQELLLMDIKRNFFEMPDPPVYLPKQTRDLVHVKPNEDHYTKFRGGLVEIGNDSSAFHYDNEGGRHPVWIEPFELCNHLVTNAEMVKFIEAGGYSDPRYWLSDGWDFIQREKILYPLYWTKDASGFSVMTLSGTVPLNGSEPASHVSYYEAQAYAKWKQARLPTEFEWEYAAGFSEVTGNFLENGIYHPEVNNSLHGNLWEWTQSAYLPYPGYAELGDGLFEYNSKFMCNQFVLRGGSAITPRDHYRITYRNFYYPHMRWQFCGFRLAKLNLRNTGI